MILHQPSRPRRLGIPGLPHGDRLGPALARRLDDGYHWFRTVAPGGMEPIDGVIVGPGGTWAITMAGSRGRYARRNGHWYRWNGSTESWVPWDAVVIAAARLAGRRLGLYLERATLPETLDVTATAEDGEIMGVRHRAYAPTKAPLEGVQFHPESILSEHGHALMKNFVEAAR